jgi:hypothetical protein
MVQEKAQLQAAVAALKQELSEARLAHDLARKQKDDLQQQLDTVSM